MFVEIHCRTHAIEINRKKNVKCEPPSTACGKGMRTSELNGVSKTSANLMRVVTIIYSDVMEEFL